MYLYTINMKSHDFFLVQFGINQQSWIFEGQQIALALRACAIWSFFKKSICADLSQISFENMWWILILNLFYFWDTGIRLLP